MKTSLHQLWYTVPEHKLKIDEMLIEDRRRIALMKKFVHRHNKKLDEFHIKPSMKIEQKALYDALIDRVATHLTAIRFIEMQYFRRMTFGCFPAHGNQIECMNSAGETWTEKYDHDVPKYHPTWWRKIKRPKSG